MSLKRGLAQWRMSLYHLYARTYRGIESSTTTFCKASGKTKTNGGACFLEGLAQRFRKQSAFSLELLRRPQGCPPKTRA